MHLLRLLHLIGGKPLRKLILFASASALSTTLVLSVVTFAAQQIDKTREEFVNLPLAVLFLLSLIVYVVFETRLVERFASDIEEAIDLLRMKLIRRLRHADLWKIEHFGQSRLFTNITQSCKVVSSNSQYLALTMRSVIQIGMILIYIATVSLLSCILLTALLAVATTVYYRLGLTLEKCQEALGRDEGKLFECVADLLDGFKEQRLNSRRSRALGEEFNELSLHTVSSRSEMHRQSWQQFVFGETMFNLMLGLVVFVIPVYSPSVRTELVKISAAVLFMVPPVFGLMQSLTVLRAAKAAAGRMMELDSELEDIVEPCSEEAQQSLPLEFSEIRMENMVFAYPAPEGEKPFTLGPLNLSVKRGEVLFITGGNGSGKSSLIKLLTSLYHPEQGMLYQDKKAITHSEFAGYRALMAPVFSDFHLFEHLYGLGEVDTPAARELLGWMEMERVVGITGNQFTRTELSTGQRKRLALVAALLEKKPILILDEWAADQDAYFRKKFYREILPELKRRGLTIIAVTHDDRYFDAADRRIHLEYGRLRELHANREDQV
ncbi:cyclic peptide export ABC transporter [Chlorobium ferrooxidans]|uniref:Cyclic peptide transporter n=1 Tax=Chlorobium ferrooxidans DSM 13031 TaxID=377431 RepID=Q0YRE4_9CHLB|nr:cyclic peptide export ABC transporter [Chlorobium ferrooxidans]EAT58852.1 Cyclic peptide transporter [Chlorobium ferrooxidans DSM 13031]